MAVHTFTPIEFDGTAADPYLNPEYYNHLEQGIGNAQGDVNQEIQDRIDADIPLSRFKKWIPGESYAYAINEPCFDEGVPYRSLVAENVDKKPSENIGTFWELVGGGGSGAGSLGYTWTNPSMESNIVGWVPYMNTTPAATPEITPGGTVPTGFTAAWNGTDPIIGKGDLLLTKPASSCYGAGIYHDFHIDRGCLGTITKLLFKILTSSGYQDGYIQMFILDKTNSNFIPVPNSLSATYTSISDWLMTFIPSTSTEYRFYLHIATSTTTAWTANFGGFELGRKDVAVGAAIGNWTSYTPSSIGGLTQGNGTLQFYWKRDGEDCLIRGKISLGTTSAISTMLTIAFPTFVTPDISVSAYEKIGSWSGFDSSSVLHTAEQAIDLGGETVLRLVNLSATTPFTWAANDEISVYEVRVKNSQWTSNINLASDFTEYASNDGSGGTAAGTTYNTGMKYGPEGSPVVAVNSNTQSSVTSYRVNFVRPIQATDRIIIEHSPDEGKSWHDSATSAYTKISKIHVLASATYGLGEFHVTGNSYCTVQFGNYGSDSSGATYGAIGRPWSDSPAYRWRVRKVSNGNMAEIPTVIRAVLQGQTVTAVNADIAWSTVQEDTHKCVDSSKTTFTAPINGIYLITGNALPTNGSVSASVQIKKNGTVLCSFADSSAALASNVGFYLGTSHTIRLNAGDVIKMSAYGSGTLAAAANCFFEITWLGK